MKRKHTNQSILKYLLILFFAAFEISVYSQPITATVSTATNAVANLVGAGITYSNIQTFGSSANSLGLFSNGLSGSIGISSGVFISTGDVVTTGPVLGDTPGTFVSTGNGTPGDADLDALSPPTFDASILQFDFIPTGDTVRFKYVFSSEEYNEYVNSGVSDVFGFFVTGPNPSGPAYLSTNVALVPATATPVSIDNVNNGNAGGCAVGPCTNCAYYNDNMCLGNNFCYDGYTVVFEIVLPVYACSTYTIKLAIADVGDGIFDSGVFLESGSFSSNQVSLSGDVNFGPSDTILIEGCNAAILTFIRTDTTDADTITFTTGGTALEGTDYSNLPSSIIFPAGVDTVYLTFNPLEDFIIEGSESIIIMINAQICGDTISTFNYYIYDIDSLDANLTPLDTFVCAGSPILFNAFPTGGVGLYTTNSWLDPSGTPFADSTSINITEQGYYVYQVHDFCIVQTHYDSVRVDVFPVPNISLSDQDICSTVGEPIGPAGALTGFNYQWSPGLNLNQTNVTNPIFGATNPGPASQLFTYVLTVDSAGVSCYVDSLVITLHPNPVVNLDDTTSFCENGSVTLNAGNPGYNYLWNTTATTQTITVNSVGTFGVLVTSLFSCFDSDSTYVTIDSLPHFKLYDVTVCEGDSAVLWVHSNEGIGFSWSNSETDTLIFTFSPGLYSLIINNSCGFTSDTAEVKFLPDISNFPLPNVLTPNGDGLNDDYAIPILSQASSFKMDFFDRWGALLHTQTDVNDIWKGTGQGDNLVPPGTYYVVINFFDCQNNEISKTQFISIFY